jgi:hypothetical protein
MKVRSSVAIAMSGMIRIFVILAFKVAVRDIVCRIDLSRSGLRRHLLKPMSAGEYSAFLSAPTPDM